MGNEVMSAGQLLKQANQLKRAGRLDEALAEDGGGSYIAPYHQAIEINPDFASTHYNLGYAFVKSLLYR
jgi:hypothetical protein